MSANSDVAIAHHWAFLQRGGEHVLSSLCELYRDAPLYMLWGNTAELDESIRSRRVHFTVFNKLPRIKEMYRYMLPIFPFAVRSLVIERGVKLLISSDAAMVKGCVAPLGCKHICYCHSPPRYVWEMQREYVNGKGLVSRLAGAVLGGSSKWLQRQDRKFAEKVDVFVANSEFVRRRIQEYYNRESVVVYPPVDVDRFRADRDREDFFLCVSQLTPYKRIDVAVEAFNRSGRRLVVIGGGEELPKLKALAKENVTLLGRQSNESVVWYMEHCRGFVFPGVEDFGITPVEAQAAGAPVFAFGRGGALETIIDGSTGAFFGEQTADALNQAIDAFDFGDASLASRCRENASRFSRARFKEEMRSVIERSVCS